MKNFLLIPVFSLLALSGIKAQVAVPSGMRYQAIARDSDGTIRSKEELDVKVELLVLESTEEVAYAESHTTTSGEFGLLNITIGEGKRELGVFDDVPWAKPIWVRISIKNANEAAYELVTTSKLYSVPYAFYAATAGKVVDPATDVVGTEIDSRTPGTGSNSINWTLEGNYNSQERNDGNPVLGTTDANDLVIVTNNIPRLTIDKDGPIHFGEDIDMDGDLNVDGATTLNSSLDVTGMSPTHLTGTLTVDNTTTLNDNLTVENMAATHLTGALDVDKTLNVDGATTLNNTLDVTGMNATSLSGTLSVDKATTLNDDLTVENMASTYLTGPLTVDGAFYTGGQISVGGALEVSGMNPTLLTGTLDVDKLVTMNAGLMVSGDGALGPNGEHLAYFNNTEGGTSDGIGIRIDNQTTNAQNNFVTFYKGDNSVAGRIEGYVLSDISSPPLPSNEEIWSAICVTIADYNPVTLMWTTFANQFNLFGTVWNGATIPAFAIPDFPAETLRNGGGTALPSSFLELMATASWCR